MSESVQLSSSDARAIVRLLGDVAVAQDGLVAQRQCLMDGLCDLVGGECWVWTTACKFEPGELPLYAGFLKGGFTEEKFARYLEACEHPDIAFLNEALTREFREKKTHLTRLREQIDVENRFPASRAYPVWCAAGVAQVIMSMRPGADGSQTAIGFYRGSERAPFLARESRIAHIVLTEVPWLYETTVPAPLEPTVARLSPRQRITLNLLLEGQSRAEIAKHLGLSVHTVDGYVKDVFRYFDVHSQPALIARFQHGDGGDVP